jgi:hypothetical protein
MAGRKGVIHVPDSEGLFPYVGALGATPVAGCHGLIESAGSTLATAVDANGNPHLDIPIGRADYGDQLNFKAGSVAEFECIMGITGSGATTRFLMGLGSAASDDPTTISEGIFVELNGATDQTQFLVTCKDGTNDVTRIVTRKYVSTNPVHVRMDFASRGRNDIQVYIDGDKVANQTTFNMSAYSGGLQPIFAVVGVGASGQLYKEKTQLRYYFGVD